MSSSPAGCRRFSSAPRLISSPRGFPVRQRPSGPAGPLGPAAVAGPHGRRVGDSRSAPLQGQRTQFNTETQPHEGLSVCRAPAAGRGDPAHVGPGAGANTRTPGLRSVRWRSVPVRPSPQAELRSGLHSGAKAQGPSDGTPGPARPSDPPLWALDRAQPAREAAGPSGGAAADSERSAWRPGPAAGAPETRRALGDTPSLPRSARALSSLTGCRKRRVGLRPERQSPPRLRTTHGPRALTGPGSCESLPAPVRLRMTREARGGGRAPRASCLGLRPSPTPTAQPASPDRPPHRDAQTRSRDRRTGPHGRPHGPPHGDPHTLSPLQTVSQTPSWDRLTGTTTRDPLTGPPVRRPSGTQPTDPTGLWLLCSLRQSRRKPFPEFPGALLLPSHWPARNHVCVPRPIARQGKTCGSGRL